MEIRQAKQDDIPQLAALNAEVQAIHTDLFPNTFRQVSTKALSEMLSRTMNEPSTTILVAEQAGQLIGYLSIRKQEKPSYELINERNCGYIDQACVAKLHRGKGVFNSLLSHAEELVAEWGFKRIELDVWSSNQVAKQAFSSSGFETYNEKMKLEL